MTKYVFVTGGVCSSLGKGVAAASIGHLLKRRGLSVALQKFDPYINVDPGTMSPYQHGEVYVTDDGAETDLDLGYYERFTDTVVSKLNSVSTGQIYNEVIKREREGGYLGATVQVIPHVTDEIKYRVKLLSEKIPVDVQIVEIGGTVGDIESVPFLEAIRQFGQEMGRKNVIFIHLTLVPHIGVAGEYKTKPTQHSVKELREIGIMPDILLCRVSTDISESMRKKIALFCNVSPEAVIAAKDIKTSIYEIPNMYAEQKLEQLVVDLLGLPSNKRDDTAWNNMLENIKGPNGTVRIAVVGKYVGLQDAYRSIYDALVHGGIANGLKVDIKRIEAEDIENQGIEQVFADVHGILVPGGFGMRGLEGKISAIKYARENKIPLLGICLGMQCSVIEFARNVCNLKGANTTEAEQETPHPVISMLDEQRRITSKGGTMRLGAYPCELSEGSTSLKEYGTKQISERHRHRYEFNSQYRNIFEENGLRIGGICPDRDLVEIIELKEHPWFVAVQYHPEFKSRPLNPHPLFTGLIRASFENKM